MANLIGGALGSIISQAVSNSQQGQSNNSVNNTQNQTANQQNTQSQNNLANNQNGINQQNQSAASEEGQLGLQDQTDAQDEAIQQASKLEADRHQVAQSIIQNL